MTGLSIHELNTLSANAAVVTFTGCCGARWWAEQMASARPYGSIEEIHETADLIFEQMAEGHWMEAFSSHPRIGETTSLKMQREGNRVWSAREQAGVDDAASETLDQLAAANARYEERFGYLFIVCASGLSADQMLTMLTRRMRNDPSREAGIASAEQTKITHLRIDKLTESPD